MTEGGRCWRFLSSFLSDLLMGDHHRFTHIRLYSLDGHFHEVLFENAVPQSSANSVTPFSGLPLPAYMVKISVGG